MKPGDVICRRFESRDAHNMKFGIILEELKDDGFRTRFRVLWTTGEVSFPAGIYLDDLYEVIASID